MLFLLKCSNSNNQASTDSQRSSSREDEQHNYLMQITQVDPNMELNFLQQQQQQNQPQPQGQVQGAHGHYNPERVNRFKDPNLKRGS